MDTFQLMLRGMVIGSGLLFCCVLLFQRPKEQITWSTCGLNLAMISENLLSLVPPEFHGVIQMLNIGRATMPFFFAWFVMVIFTDSPVSFRDGSIGVRIVLGIAGLAFLSGFLPHQDAWIVFFCQMLAITTYVGSVVLVLASAKDDLVQRRRQARTAFVISLGFAGTIFTGIQFFPSLEAFATEIGIVKSLVIFALIAMAAAFILQTGDAFMPRQKSGNSGGDGGEDVADWLVAKIESTMRDRAWAEEGLTISTLADRVGAPEYLVRRTINQRMGFRNFPTFVNSYRIRAARHLLSDPDQSRKSVLEIAYEVGFASLGPFNKAFKDFSEVTPTEFRRAAFQAQSSISENLH
ncbi:MAG: AraC family transcriptional regulator [Pseudomonadota bacterium]